jgi:hypothetical protein
MPLPNKQTNNSKQNKQTTGPNQKKAKTAIFGLKMSIFGHFGGKKAFHKQSNNTKQRKKTINKHYLVRRAEGPFFAKQDTYMSCSEKGQNSYFLGSKIRFSGHLGV